MKRIICLFLTVVMLVGTFMLDVGAYAVDLIYVIDEETKEVTEEIDYAKTVAQYLTADNVFETAEAKLASMELKLEREGYQLYVDPLTGEVATKNTASGQILFSNPYDVASSNGSESTKKTLMSQIIIRYTDNDTEKYMYSFTDAAQNGQIKIKNIKNGIRIEYTIGREETRMLVPKLIEKESFETRILDPFAEELNKISVEQGGKALEWRDYFTPVTKRAQMLKDSGNDLWFEFNKLLANYQYKSVDACSSEREILSLYATFPICKKMDVYVFDPYASSNEKLRIETIIKTYVPSYTYEQLEADHQLTEYEGTDKAPPLFKLSLEYSLDEWGMQVRMPVNGLRFDESLYQITYLSILPWMGAGANYLLDEKTETFTGYNVFPDGPGTIFRHEELNTASTTTINGKIYGQDYAYNTITGSHQEIIRYPVFGIVSNYHDIREKTEKVLVSEAVVDPTTGTVINPAVYEDVKTEYTYEEDRGFVAIIEEGDSLAELSTYHAGSTSKYNTVQMLFYPRPKDSYNLANSISVGSNASWTVVSSRKYVGNYKIRYIMLTDTDIAAANGITEYYEPTWMGMASAYRDYLYYTGDLSTLTEKDVSEDIPVYIETFGTLETVEKIMSIPVNVMTPLTSFDNIKTMYDELSAEGVSNIKFRLTGYANGGMYSSVPYNLKWENSVGGSSGFSDLLAYAAEKGFEVFPDFNFVYVRSETNTLFDGLTLKKHAVKSINDTYMSKRYYSATRQTYMGRYELAISPAYYDRFYTKLSANLMKFYGDADYTKSISVGTLGTDLNSDFDTDEPYNREDDKSFTIDLLDRLSKDYDHVMTEGANAYAWKYIDYIVNVPLDSSRYNKSSAAIPFIGVVLHGSIQFAGTPINMEGNIAYSMLKAIENGAGLYFTLCYDNYEELKEDRNLSQYYSVRYDILKEDVVKYYTILNDLTSDLQLQKITAHEFLIGERVADPDEVIADALAAEKELAEEAKKAEEEAKKEQIAQLLSGRIYAVEDSTNALGKVQSYYQTALDYYTGGVHLDENGNVTYTIGMKTLVEVAKAATLVRQAAEADYDVKNEAATKKNEALIAIAADYNTARAKLSAGDNAKYASLLTALATAQTNAQKQQDTLDAAYTAYTEALATSVSSVVKNIPAALNDYQTKKTTLDSITDTTTSAYKNAKAAADAALLKVNTLAGSVANAEAYVAAEKAATEAAAALAAFDKAYLESAEYLALKDASEKAAKALSDAEAPLSAAVAATDAYIAAKAAADEAAKTLAGTTRESAEYLLAAKAAKAAKDALTNFNASYIDSDEYKALQALVDSTAAALAAITDPDSAEYKAALAASDKAQADLDKIADSYKTDAGYVALKDTADKAAAALAAYEANYLATYKNSAEYKAADATAKSTQKTLDNLLAVINGAAPAAIQAVCDAYIKASAARDAATAARSAIKDTTSAEYTAANEAYTLANAEFSTTGTAVRSVDATLYNAVYRYVSAITTMATRTAAVTTAQEACDKSEFKAQYDIDNAAYEAILPAYQKANDEANAAALEKSDATKLLTTSKSAETLAYRNVSSQVTRVSNNIKAENSSVKTANTALTNTRLAVKLLSNDANYNAEFKADLASVAAQTETLVAEVNRLSDLSIVAAKAALEVAATIVDVTITIEDPKAPAAPVEDEKDDDETEEDEYEYTKYTDDSGNIVRVEYENGVFFILNYNYFDVTTVYNGVTYTIAKNGGVKVQADGTAVYFSVT